MIELGDASVVILHKGRLAGAQRREIARLEREWHPLYVNSVFLVLSRDRRRAALPIALKSLLYYDTVGRYLAARENRRLPHRIFYLHIPKTGGRSMWLALRRAFPSHIYYTSVEQMLKNPPGDAFDLIGGHFSLPSIAPHLAEEDWVVGMVREPTARFRSAFLHARRAGEDGATFTPAMRAMREGPIAEFLATREGRIEARLQLAILGGGDGTAGDPYAGAVAALARPRCFFGPSEASHEFLAVIAQQFGLGESRLPHVNRNDYEAQAADVAEFDALAGAVAAENRLERLLYTEIVDRFAQRVRSLRVPPRPPARRPSAA